MIEPVLGLPFGGPIFVAKMDALRLTSGGNVPKLAFYTTSQPHVFLTYHHCMIN
jgi:hypothetical protein